MKINNSIGPNLTGVETSKSKDLEALKSDKQNLKSSQNLEGSAKVNLSERAQLMQKAKDIASQSEDMNESKIARLQKLIDEGKYQVDASAIADRLVDEHMMYPSE
ncbi:MAG: flagellar biosynthesis anti-sigma factor FlgM [Bdellovibrionaceae bacterium]|nr:flagellar biosynthesis anti-sigma factor FlgM [Pseudobdellovibrionaceae bacterium]